MNDFGERARRAREDAGFDRVKVCNITKINYKTLSRYEKGGSEPDIETIRTLAELYGVSSDYLLGIDSKDELYDEIKNLQDEERKETKSFLLYLKSKRKGEN